MDLDYVAIYGALISTILACREYMNSRPQLELSSCYFGHPEYDDVITIYNNSNKNVVINSLKIKKGAKNISLGNEADYYLINIKPQEAHSIYIPEQYKFKWEGEPVYLEIKVMGKKKLISKKIN